MFKRKKQPYREEMPGSYTIAVEREYHSTGVHTITSIPENVFADIDQWCLDMGLAAPSVRIPPFAPLNLCSGDSVRFTLRINFTCGKAAMLFKLAHGGVGQMGISSEVTI